MSGQSAASSASRRCGKSGALARLEQRAAYPNKSAQRKQSRDRVRLIAAICGLLFVATVSALVYRRMHPTPKLTDKDTILLAEFENRTNDPVFNGTFRPALEAAFAQTPFLNPLSSDKVSHVLKAMNKPPKRAPGPRRGAGKFAFGLNSAAYIAGSILDAGNQYVIEISAVDCGTGKTLASTSGKAEERTQVIATLGTAAFALRARLGEPRPSLERFNTPLEEATTASVEALQVYSAGESQYGKPEAIEDYKRAAQLDPEFALAYDSLGLSQYNLRRPDIASENIRKAFGLRERRMMLRDRLAIEGSFYQLSTLEFDKGMTTTEQAIAEFPRYWRPRNEQGWILNQMGDYERAVPVLREALRLVPDIMPPYGTLAESYIALDRLQDATLVLEQARAHNVDAWALRAERYRIAFLQNDQQGMKEQVRWASDKPQVVDLLLKEQSETEAYYGRLHNADRLMNQAVEAAVQAGVPERTANWKAIEALRAARVGEPVRARDLAKQAAEVPNSSWQARQMAGMALAESGDITRAQQLEQQLRAQFPLGTLMQGSDAPSIQAQIYLQQGNPRSAIEVLKPAVPYDLRFSHQFGLDSAYVRGEAYLQAGDAQHAAAEFRKLVNHPGIIRSSINGPLARLQLARSQVMMGDKDAARKSYQDFLTLWKDADPDVPIYKQAKAEYGKLH